jgi:hypothetical protein
MDSLANPKAALALLSEHFAPQFRLKQRLSSALALRRHSGDGPLPCRIHAGNGDTGDRQRNGALVGDGEGDACRRRSNGRVRKRQAGAREGEQRVAQHQGKRSGRRVGQTCQIERAVAIEIACHETKACGVTVGPWNVVHELRPEGVVTVAERDIDGIVVSTHRKIGLAVAIEIAEDHVGAFRSNAVVPKH